MFFPTLSPKRVLLLLASLGRFSVQFDIRRLFSHSPTEGLKVLFVLCKFECTDEQFNANLNKCDTNYGPFSEEGAGNNMSKAIDSRNVNEAEGGNQLLRKTNS